MAVETRELHSAELLTPARCRLPALLAAADLIAAAALAVTVVLAGQAPVDAWIVPAVIFASAWALSAGATVQLLRGRLWAQRYLLGASLAVTVAGLGWLFYALLYAEPGTISLQPTLVAGAVVVVLSGLLAWQLTLAAAAGTRLRYGSMVAVSAAAAVGVLLAVNFIAQADYWRVNAELIGRFGLSERTRRIIDGVQQPVTLTVVYTSQEPETSADQYRPRVLELLQEMHERNERIDVANITGDAAKARLIARLRQEMVAQAGTRHAFLQSFVADTEPIVAQLRNQAGRFKNWPADSYLGMFGLPTELERIFSGLADDVDRLRTDVRRELTATSLPDYPALIQRVTESLDAIDKSMAIMENLMDLLAEVPPAVTANAPAALQHVRQATEQFEKVAQQAGQPGSDAPDDPAETLRQMVETMGQAVSSANKAADSLQLIAGQDRIDLIVQTDVWYLSRFPLHVFYAAFAQEAGQLRLKLQTAADTMTPEAQARTITSYRTLLGQYAGQFTLARQRAEQALQALSTVDAQTAAILQQARDGDVFGDLAGEFSRLNRQAGQLEQVDEESTLSQDVTRDNIVIVETGGKIEVVPFDQVWPQQQRDLPPGAGTAGVPREFHGDAAIGSRILSMTRQPFATIYLAYAPAGRQPQMQMYMQPPPPATEMFTVLRERLTRANFEVIDWDLSGPMPEPPAPAAGEPNAPARPRALLVLPATDAMSGRFTDEHVSRLRQAVDTEGIPAMVLTYAQLMPFGPPPDALLNEWLTEQWGIEPQSDHLILPCVPDTEQPGRYRIDIGRFTHLPLSTFTDHRVGKPLQGRRMLWTMACPILIGDPNAGVHAEPLLTVPPGWNDTWATSRVQELSAQLQTGQGFVSPDFAAGDVAPPFPVAVAASRSAEADPNAAPARLIVAGLAAGLRDGYVDSRVLRIMPDGGTMTADAPTGNADVVINAMYWLTGAETYIAAGPARGQPVRLISEPAQRFLWLLCVVVLPLAVVGIGGTILLIRRR